MTDNLLMKIYACEELAIYREYKINEEIVREWFENEKEFNDLLDNGLIEIVGFRGFLVERGDEGIAGRKLIVRLSNRGLEVAKTLIKGILEGKSIDKNVIKKLKELKDLYGFIPYEESKSFLIEGLTFKAKRFDDHGRYLGEELCVPQELLIISLP
ncbi:MAG: hypothetical protein OWQ54_06380 [Sulfolobaceae archaeon]|nr:hypothetical protein [Sulfolobaceae archaeon]